MLTPDVSLLARCSPVRWSLSPRGGVRFGWRPGLAFCLDILLRLKAADFNRVLSR